MKHKAQFDKDLIHSIDQLIIDTGNYQAIELLLHLDLLPYAEYEKWRMGKIPHLSEILNSRKEVITPLLDEAERYVKSLKMISEPVFLYQWEQNETHKSLQICRDKSAFSNYLSKQYFRNNNNDQMDLFFDNQSLTIINDLKYALISRNIQVASQKFQALYDIEPQNEIIKPAKSLLDTLINALEEEQVTDPDHEMQYLLNELAPLARKTLAGKERDYMSLFWRRLARYIDDSLYIEDSAHENNEKMHTSVCFEQIPDWQAIIDSIEKIPAEKQQAKLFARYTLALRKSGKQKQYIQALCQYYWQFTDQCMETLVTNDPMLKTIWHDFQELELDDKWGIQNFPCWLLIKTPGVSHHIITEKETPETFRILHKLVLTEINENTQSIPLRKQLKATNTAILDYYLKQK